jgi:UDP-N-acetyl-D-glucosamine dehydrogenase
VPTPLKNGKPDLSHLINSTKKIAKIFQEETLVILESTVAPKTTEEIVKPILDSSGKKYKLVFSPERIALGQHSIEDIPKVVGGLTEEATKEACELYSQIVCETIPVNSPLVAEMSKLLENVFRWINFAFVNEFSQYCHKIDVNPWDVIGAAKTKPFGFFSLPPTIDVGGYCMPKDPQYLYEQALKDGFSMKFISLSNKIMNDNFEINFNRIKNLASKQGKKILIIGVAYKEYSVSETRNSPFLKLAHRLKKEKFNVTIYDEFCDLSKIKIKSIKDINLDDFNLVIYCNKQKKLDEKSLYKANCVFDVKDKLKEKDNIVKL